MVKSRRLLVVFVVLTLMLYLLTLRRDSTTFMTNHSRVTAVENNYKSKRVSFFHRRRKCTLPVSSFVFLKTHKTASTAMSYLLYKYSQLHKLTHKLVNTFPHPFIGGYPGKFRCVFKNPRNGTISLWHTRFDADEMRRCYPPETKYITIIREPWAAFQSGYDYYAKTFENKSNCFGMPITYVRQGQNLSVNEFLLKSSKLLNASAPWYFRFRNYQSHDLGLDPMLTDEEKIQRHIQQLDEDMDLVMINEYMDESLVLLKDEMCMTWDDVKMPVYTTKKHTSSFPFASDEEKRAFQKLNNIDIALYEHFNRTLWKRVDAYGHEKFAVDLEKVRAAHQFEGELDDENKEYEFGWSRNIVWTQSWWMALKQYMNANAGRCFIP